MDSNMNPYGAPQSVAASEASVRSYLLSVFGLMAAGLVVTGLVSYLTLASGLYQFFFAKPQVYLVIFAPLGVALWLSARFQSMSLNAVRACYWAYVSLLGVSLSSLFVIYTGQSLMSVFFITAGMFGAMSAYGAVTRADLSSWGSFLLMGLVGVVIAGFVNVFLQSNMLGFLGSVVGVIVFTGLTAYDVNKLKALAATYGTEGEEAKRAAVMGALSLYLDFVNLFLSLLRLMGNRR